jgi:hypothetical protein
LDLAHQIHEYNPGSDPATAFWTIPVSPDAAQVDLEAGTASLRLENLPVPDFHDVVRALQQQPPVAMATLSFNIQWSRVVRRLRIENETDGFAGSYIEDIATAEWSAQQEGFEFISDPASTSANVYSVIGSERNGVFFRRGHGEDDDD